MPRVSRTFFRALTLAAVACAPPPATAQREAKDAATNARRQLLDWLNFKRAQLLAAEGQFDEAKRAAERVGEIDQRAILYFEIAREGVKRMSNKARAAELLDEVLAAASKAPLTDVRARAQLGVAHLYAEFDGLRSLEVVGDAVKTINQLKDPDLAGTFLTRRIEGKTTPTVKKAQP